MNGVQPDFPQPDAISLVHKLSYKILKENADEFVEDVPQTFNNFDPFIGYNYGQFLSVNFITLHRYTIFKILIRMKQVYLSRNT